MHNEKDRYIWMIMIKIAEKVFKNGPSKTCGRQSSKNLKGCIWSVLGRFFSIC